MAKLLLYEIRYKMFLCFVYFLLLLFSFLFYFDVSPVNWGYWMLRLHLGTSPEMQSVKPPTYNVSPG